MADKDDFRPKASCRPRGALDHDNGVLRSQRRDRRQRRRRGPHGCRPWRSSQRRLFEQLGWWPWHRLERGPRGEHTQGFGQRKRGMCRRLLPDRLVLGELHGLHRDSVGGVVFSVRRGQWRLGTRLAAAPLRRRRCELLRTAHVRPLCMRGHFVSARLVLAELHRLHGHVFRALVCELQERSGRHDAELDAAFVLAGHRRLQRPAHVRRLLIACLGLPSRRERNEVRDEASTASRPRRRCSCRRPAEEAPDRCR